MADTFEEIYKSTSLGSSQLDDGEETILTTNSSTRYVIKDMYVSGTSGLPNTYLELNGVNVGGIQSNATGSLIIPPNSTLKIKTSDYPYKVYQNTYWAAAASSDFGTYIDYEDSNNNKISVPSGELDFYFGNMTGGSQVGDVMYVPDAGTANEPFIYATRSDNNSSHHIQYINATTYSTSYNDNNGSYRPYAVWDSKAWQYDGTVLKYHDFTSNSTGTNWQNFAPNVGTNNFNPYPTSSYPRHKICNGWSFYARNSAVQSRLYGVKLYGSNSGTRIYLDFTNQHIMSSNNGTFTVSINESTNELVVYRQYTNSQVVQEIFSNWSTINNSTHTSPASYTSSSSTIIQTTVDTSNMSDMALGTLKEGGFSYKDTSNNLVRYNYDGTTTSSSAWPGSASTLNAPNYGFNLNQSELSSSQMTSYGISAPTFSLMLLGVKST